MSGHAITGLVLTLVGVSAFAATDATCLRDCTSRGYQYQYCYQRCSYDSNSNYVGNGGGIDTSLLTRPPPVEQIKPFEPIDFGKAMEDAERRRNLELQNQLLEEQIRRQRQGQ